MFSELAKILFAFGVNVAPWTAHDLKPERFTPWDQTDSAPIGFKETFKMIANGLAEQALSIHSRERFSMKPIPA